MYEMLNITGSTFFLDKKCKTTVEMAVSSWDRKHEYVMLRVNNVQILAYA